MILTSILARPMIGAVVEILVAEEAPPAFLAQTLPGFVAGAVVTSRVFQTKVAPFAAPTLLAPENIAR